MQLYDFQKKGLEATSDKNKVAYYWDMGTGKTFVGSEKAVSFGKQILVVCQKSKINDWVEHFRKHYYQLVVRDITITKNRVNFMNGIIDVGVINYDSYWRKRELLKLRGYTLMLDESSLIQNYSSKRSKFALALSPDNVILLSGTPCNGKYENLWTQLKMLGWNISKREYWDRYVLYRVDTSQGFPLTFVYGYKNVAELKEKLYKYGCNFLKTEEVISLPEQVETKISVSSSLAYRKLKKDGIVELDDKTLVGDTTLTKMLYLRMLCGSYSDAKLKALKDLVDSTEDRLIIFYNFQTELDKIKSIIDKPISEVNGKVKDLNAYFNSDNSVTLIQYQSGAMGLNLQKCNKIIYFTPPLSCEYMEQSKKRTHRIGQTRTCFYWKLVCTGTIEERIYSTLAMRRDFTNKLFEDWDNAR